MKYRLKHFKHSVAGLVLVLAMVAVPAVAVFLPQTAYANGEVYSWSDKNTITIAGGATRGDAPGNAAAMNKVFSQGPSNTNLPGPSQERFNGTAYITQNGSGCELQVTLYLTNPNGGTINYNVVPSGGIGDSNPKCSSTAGVTNGPITVAGTRPGSNTETQAQKDVQFIIVGNVGFDQGPATINLSYKNAAGTVVAGPVAAPKQHGPRQDSSQIDYPTYAIDSPLEPGDYQVCADQFISCVPFTKILGQSINQTLGATPTDSTIATDVTFSYLSSTSSPDLTFGPYTINLLDKGGNDLGNPAQTNTFVVKSLNGDGTAQVKQDVMVSSLTRNVAPGDYQVCLQGLNKCVPVHKDQGQAHVTIALSSTEAAAAVLAAQNHTPLGQGATKPTCETTEDNNAWLICPLFNGLAGFTDAVYDNLLQPFLYTAPISTSASDESFQVWSTFRIYGDIFLVAAVLIIVFGESIGGGLIDAYTAKRALPRVLAAAILINLSVYIVALLVDATNILGATIGRIVTAPIDLSFRPPASVGDTSIAGGLIGLMIGAGGIATVITGLFTLKAAFIKAALYVAFFALLPIFLAIATVFMILVLRKGLILALVLLSPIAFALYCLPSTEKWFRRWWNMLFKSLMLYPAIALIYAVADVLAVSIMKANGATAGSIKNGTLFTGSSGHHILPHVASMFNFAADPTSTGAGGAILAFIVAIFVEGGIKFIGVVWVVRKGEEFTAGIFQSATNGAKRFNKAFDNRRELGKKRLQGQMIQNRERAYRAFGKMSGSGNAATRFLGRRMQNSIQGGGLRDVLGESANYRADQMKVAEAINSTGDDTQLRALTVNKRWALEQGNEATEANGWKGDWRRNANGGREFRTLAGNKWVSEGDVDAAYTRWGNNQAIMQWSLGHEMDKAATQNDQDHLRSNYKNLTYRSGVSDALGAGQGWNMSDGEMTGMWTGAAFAKQNTNREWKHYKWSNGDLKFDRLSAARELDEKKSPYELGQTNADMWTSMSQGVIDARKRHDTLTEFSKERQLTAAEQNQLRDDKEFLGRASRLAGRMKASGAIYGGVTADNGQPIPTGAAAMQPGQSIPLQSQNLTPQQAAQQAAQVQARTEASIGAGSVSRTGEEQVRFTRLVEQYAPEYTGPDMANTPGGSAPGIPQWGGAPGQTPYGTQPGTEDAIAKRVGSGRRGEGQ